MRGYEHSKFSGDELNSLNLTLKWLHDNVRVDSAYWLFILYDYLVTYRWLWSIRYKNGLDEEDVGFIDKNQINITKILNSLKKQLLKNNKITNDNLQQL